MGTRTLAVLITVAFSAIGVLGDYFLKLASAREQSLRTSWFYLGFALYASTAFGWVFVMKHLKLATISVLYVCLPGAAAYRDRRGVIPGVTKLL